MKCVADLVALTIAAEAAHQLDEARLDAEARAAYEQMTANAIALCDGEIDAALTSCAMNREPLTFRFVAKMETDRLGNDFFKVARPDGRSYADGRISYSPSGERIAVAPFLEYLESHCLSVTVTDDGYWEYNCGYRHGLSFTISAG